MCNLYVWHDGTTRLVAVLSGGDNPDWSRDLMMSTARVSPDGRWLAFMSRRSLTGYDTRDAVTGRADEEVYLYHAQAGGGRLVCASCDPTGARPVGVEYGKMDERIDGRGTWEEHQGLAGSVPGWTGFHDAYSGSQSRHQPRYLSDNGRLFFNSSDALVAQDVNGTGDVYEYEPLGVPYATSSECSPASASFGVLSNGCVGLVSSGSSGEESGFLDASVTGGREAEGHEGGGDVFFLTGARLSPADGDTSPDVYDAHECSPAVPCVAPPPLSPPPCTTGDACKSAPTPQPAIFGSPASATFTGMGNPVSPVSGTVTPKGLTRAQKLARALKACRKRPKRKRPACEKQARRTYGPVGKAKKSNRRAK
jgi:hypothetical protein